MAMPRKPVAPGTVFGYLTAIGPGPDLTASDRVARTSTLCRCVCGREVVVSNSNLKRGTTKSCGCMQKKMLRDAQVKHGERYTRLYKCWDCMIDRCTNPSNPSYAEYGGRGITVCDSWRKYENFSLWAKNNGYMDSLTIDRIDVNGNYCPENCRWTDLKMQANNKRNNKLLTVDGITHTLQEWADLSGNSFALILWRLNAGKSVKEAIFNPPRNRGPKISGTHGVMYTAFGRTMNIKQWSEFLGVKRTTLSQNLKRGATIEQYVSRNGLLVKPDEIKKTEEFKVDHDAIAEHFKDLPFTDWIPDEDLASTTVDQLAECFAKEFYESERSEYDSFDDAMTAGYEWVDYNVVRSLPYWGEHAPIILERDPEEDNSNE